MYVSMMLISECEFVYNQASSSVNFKVPTLETYGSFIYAIMSTNLTVNNSMFENGLSKMGGAIYLSGGKLLY